MFKNEYLAQLQTWFTSLAPEGYTVKVVEHYGTGFASDPKFGITIYVKFGVGAKQASINNRITQPVSFVVKSEGEDFRTAESLLETFFNTYSRATSTLTIDEEGCTLWHIYTTPVVRSNVEKDNGHFRYIIDMMGVISYSKNIIVGVKYYLKTYDDNLEYEEIKCVMPQNMYMSEVISQQYINEDTGRARVQGANNQFKLKLLLTSDDYPMEMLYSSINGTVRRYTMKIVYPGTPADYVYERNVKLTSCVVTNDSETGDNIIEATFMPF